MKTLGFVAAATLMAVVGAPAGAQDAAAPTSDQAAQQEKKICRSQKMTGSLTRVRRTCLTRAQWDRLAEGTQRAVDELNRDANQVQARDFVQQPTPGSQP